VSVHPSDTYVLPDGRKVRMMNKNLLVKIDKPAEKTASGLVLYPGGAMEHANNTGTILAFGYEYDENGERIPLRDLEVGLKVLFVRFLADQHTNEQIREMFGEDIIRLQPSDVFFVYTPDEHSKIAW
jgi:co-chaperonin GroES (HSP10)